MDDPQYDSNVLERKNDHKLERQTKEWILREFYSRG